MAQEQQSISEAFADWVKKATQEQLEELASEIEHELFELEENDYFGTEGLNKRFSG